MPIGFFDFFNRLCSEISKENPKDAYQLQQTVEDANRQKLEKSDLKEQAGISSASIAKLGKGDNITTDVLLRICEAMNCHLDDIMETVDE